MVLQNLKNFLNPQPKQNTEKVFRVTVVAFEDKCNMNCGFRLAEILKQNQLFDVRFFNEPFAKNFLNLQSRNFFDFIDRGSKILDKTQSDILIWGYEEEGKIRLNFQIKNQYVIPNSLSFSLLDSLFAPLSYFVNPENFSASFLTLVSAVIVAAVNPVTNDQKKLKPQILYELIKSLSQDTAPKDIAREFMPYIMNMLGKIYLTNAAFNLNETTVKIIADLFETALKNRQYIRLPIYYGCMYNNMGQLYEAAFYNGADKNLSYLRPAISNYQEALKHLNRNYPYDYGVISYHLALMYFEFWKSTTDLQALRDAVSQLREAEKVFSLTQFPQSWCHIEGLLGYYLTLLGMSTHSHDLMQLAINSYKNAQKIYEQSVYPREWAEIQGKIGHIYYLLGKQNEDEKFMLEARNYFNSALEIYEGINYKTAVSDTRKSLQKIKNYID